MATYDVFHVPEWGVLVALYFYLTGLSAGSFVLSVAAVLFGKKEYKALSRIGAVLAPALLIIAPIILIFDLGQPLRFYYMLLNFNATSIGSWGVWFLTLYPLNAVIYAYHVFKGNERASRLFGALGIPLALLVHGYTGYVLALNEVRALWHTALMPWLFLVSAMVSGIALVILVAIVYQKVVESRAAQAQDEVLVLRREAAMETGSELLYSLGRVLAWTIVLDLLMVGTDLLTLLNGHADEVAAAKLLLSGTYAPLFLGVEVLAGGILPLFILFNQRLGRSLAGQAVASTLVLIGVFAMRYVVVFAGQAVPL